MIPLMNSKCHKCGSITIMCPLPLCGSQYSQGVPAINSSASMLVVLFHLNAPLPLKGNLKVGHFLQDKI